MVLNMKLCLGGLLLFLLTGCANCESHRLDSTACHPGNPSRGDYDPALHERCDNDIDDNCDGNVNEGCACRDGDKLTCQQAQGECARLATVICVAGQWPDCPEQGLPQPETCNGLDDNCDGVVDNLPPDPCWTGPVLPPNARCHVGTRACLDGVEICAGQTLPEPEICDGIDNDCDGVVDNGLSSSSGPPCGPLTATGSCRFGSLTCSSGELRCVGAVFPSPEVCDGIDNDCDGVVDNGLFRICSTACEHGIETCNEGFWVECTARSPVAEICDGQDNDCNGQIDDGITCECHAGDLHTCREGITNRYTGDTLTCGVGIAECLPSGQWGTCYFWRTEPETCNNWDDDCDGIVDGEQEACDIPPRNVGACHAGTRTCTAGQFSTCHGAVQPASEICDGIDNDCNGQTDEGLNPHNVVDMVFAIDISGSMCTYINALRQALNMYASDFVGTRHRFALVTFPGVDPTGYTHPVMPASFLTVVLNFSDVSTFQFALANMDCNGGGVEPSIDVMWILTDPTNPAGLNWRSDAYPYIVEMTDEEGQTWTQATFEQDAYSTANCRVAGCNPGDAFEVFMLTYYTYFEAWLPVVLNDPNRLINITPPDQYRYLEAFRSVLSNVCR